MVYILLAEDYEMNRRIALLHLQNAGYEVEIAENGIEAVDLFKKKKFDIVLMDIEMPEMDGKEAASQIREFEKSKNPTDNSQIERAENKLKSRTPIVAMTAHDDEDVLKECFEAGMDDYLTKPIKQKNIVAIVEKWIHRENMDGIPDKNRGEFADNKTATDAKPFDYEMAMNAFDNDTKLTNELLSILLRDGKKRVNTLRKAIDENNHKIIFHEAHTLKGASANIFVHALTNAAARMEELAESNDLNAKNEALESINRELELVDSYLKSEGENI